MGLKTVSAWKPYKSDVVDLVQVSPLTYRTHGYAITSLEDQTLKEYTLSSGYFLGSSQFFLIWYDNGKVYHGLPGQSESISYIENIPEQFYYSIQTFCHYIWYIENNNLHIHVIYSKGGMQAATHEIIINNIESVEDTLLAQNDSQPVMGLMALDSESKYIGISWISKFTSDDSGALIYDENESELVVQNPPENFDWTPSFDDKHFSCLVVSSYDSWGNGYTQMKVDLVNKVAALFPNWTDSIPLDLGTTNKNDLISARSSESIGSPTYLYGVLDFIINKNNQKAYYLLIRDSDNWKTPWVFLTTPDNELLEVSGFNDDSFGDNTVIPTDLTINRDSTNQFSISDSTNGTWTNLFHTNINKPILNIEFKGQNISLNEKFNVTATDLDTNPVIIHFPPTIPVKFFTSAGVFLGLAKTINPYSDRFKYVEDIFPSYSSELASIGKSNPYIYDFFVNYVPSGYDEFGGTGDEFGLYIATKDLDLIRFYLNGMESVIPGQTRILMSKEKFIEEFPELGGYKEINNITFYPYREPAQSDTTTPASYLFIVNFINSANQNARLVGALDYQYNKVTSEYITENVNSDEKYLFSIGLDYIPDANVATIEVCVVNNRNITETTSFHIDSNTYGPFNTSTSRRIYLIPQINTENWIFNNKSNTGPFIIIKDTNKYLLTKLPLIEWPSMASSADVIEALISDLIQRKPAWNWDNTEVMSNSLLVSDTNAYWRIYFQHKVIKDICEYQVVLHDLTASWPITYSSYEINFISNYKIPVTFNTIGCPISLGSTSGFLDQIFLANGKLCGLLAA